MWPFLTISDPDRHTGLEAGNREKTQQKGPFPCRKGPGEVGTPGRIRTCDPRLRRPMLYPAELRARALESTTYGTTENTASRFCQPNRVRTRRRHPVRTVWTRERHVMLLQLRRGVDHRRLTSPYSPAASNSSPTSALAGTTGAGGRDEERRRLVETGVVRLLADHLRWPHAGQCLSRSVLRFGTPASMRQRGRGARRASTSAGRRTRPGSP